MRRAMLPGEPRRAHTLGAALGVRAAGVYAFVGAGGKTAAIRRLLLERPQSLATTTTHLAGSGFGAGLLAVGADVHHLERMQACLEPARPLVLALRGDGRRLQSPPLEWHRDLAARHARERLLVEADGAAQHLLKMPGAHEPAWPPAELAAAVVVLGLDALGRPVREVAQRPEAFARAGLRAARVGLEHFELALARYVRAAPPRAPIALLLTGAGSERTHAVRHLVRVLQRCVRGRDPALQDPSVALRVVATPAVHGGSLAVWDLGRGARRTGPRLPGVCGVLLAAGSGTRFGGSDPKLLASWRGRPLLESTLHSWLGAGFAEIVIVLGHEASSLEPVVERAARRAGARVRVVRNRQHERGLGSSVRAAARAAPEGMGLLFGHGDMPALGVRTLRELGQLGTTLRRAIVLPTVRGAPRNPVYFPADLRGELRRVGDAEGGRPVIASHPERVFRCERPDPAEFVDVDRRRDLRRLGGDRLSRRRCSS